MHMGSLVVRTSERLGFDSKEGHGRGGVTMQSSILGQRANVHVVNSEQSMVNPLKISVVNGQTAQDGRSKV